SPATNESLLSSARATDGANATTSTSRSIALRSIQPRHMMSSRSVTRILLTPLPLLVRKSSPTLTPPAPARYSSSTMTSPFDFTGQSILAAGAAKGIGAGIAERSAHHGATVCCAVRRPESVEPTRTAIAAITPNHFVFAMDISQPAQIDRGFAQLQKQFA